MCSKEIQLKILDKEEGQIRKKKSVFQMIRDEDQKAYEI